MTSAGLVRAKSRRPFAASTGSPVTNAMAVGPASAASSRAVPPAPGAAIAVRVFLPTAYVACPPMLRRSWVSCDTVRPRYSVRTAALEVRNLSDSSATVAVLSALAMALLPGSSCRAAAGVGGRTGPDTTNAPAQGARGVRRRPLPGPCTHSAGPALRKKVADADGWSVAHLRGPPADAGPSTTLAGGDRRSLAVDKRTGRHVR